MNLESGFFNCCEALGFGRGGCVIGCGDDNAFGFVDGRLAGDIWRIFLGRLERGGACNTSF